MLCDDCGRELVRKGDYNPPVWKCYHCNIEIEEDGGDVDLLGKQIVLDTGDDDRI